MATLAVVIPSTIDVLIRGAGRLIVADEVIINVPATDGLIKWIQLN